MMVISIYLAAKIEEENIVFVLNSFLKEFFKLEKNNASWPLGYPGELDYWTKLEIELCKTLNFEF